MAKSLKRTSICFVLAIALAFTMMPLAAQPAKAADRSPAGAVTMPASKTMTLTEGVNTKINFGTTYDYQSYYYFRIVPKKAGYISITSDYISGWDVALCNASKKLASRESKSLDDFLSSGSSHAYQNVLNYGVKAGTVYYIRVKGASGDRASYDQPYVGSIKWTNKAVKNIKYGKTKKKAAVLKRNKAKNGVIKAGSRKHQWFKIRTAKKKFKISISAKHNCGTIYAKVHYKTYGRWTSSRMSAMRHDDYYKDSGVMTTNARKKQTYYIEVYPQYKSSGEFILKWK